MENNWKDLLNEPPPQSALATRKGGFGNTLTYIEGFYAIETMNRIFGPLGWQRRFTGDGLRTVDKREYKNPNKGDALYVEVAMLCDYQVTVTVDGETITVEDTGQGSGQNPEYQGYGPAFESAAKEAVTDALKRCCRSLGNALGNCLYNKDWMKHKGTKAAPKPKAKPAPKPKAKEHTPLEKAKIALFKQAAAVMDEAGLKESDDKKFFKDATMSLIKQISIAENKSDTPQTMDACKVVADILSDKEKLGKYMAPKG